MSARTRSEIIKLIRYSESLNSKVSEDSREALRSLIDQGLIISLFTLLLFSDSWCLENYK